MKYVYLIAVFFAAALGAEESKIVPVGKKINASEEQIRGLFQFVEKTDPTPTQIEKTKEFLDKNPLPPRELFIQRKETVDNFLENVLGRDPSKTEVRKTMEFLIEQETTAKIKAEETLKNPGQGLSQSRLPGSVSPGVADSSLEAVELATASGLIGGAGVTPQGPPGSSSASPGAPAPASASDGEETGVSNRSGHSGGSGFVAPESAQGGAGVSPALSLSPPSLAVGSPVAIAPSIQENLKEALDERVNVGQITPEEGQRAMKDILSDFESGRLTTPVQGDVLAKDESPLAPKPISVPQELRPTLGSVGPSDPGQTPPSALMGKWQISPPLQAGVVTLAPSPEVAGAMAKQFSDLGTASLAPDGKAGDFAANDKGGRVQTAGAAATSGSFATTGGDNSGQTPALNAKSGGTMDLTAPGEAPQKKVSTWLGKFVDEYLKRGKMPGDNRLLASPHPIGLPKGALSHREEAPVSFIPEGRGDYLFMAQAAPEAFLKHSTALPYLVWTLFAVIGIKAALMFRKKAHEDEEARQEPKII